MRFTFRPLTPDDLPAVVRWQASPAAAPWFGGGLSLDAARARYLPRLGGPTAVRMFVLHWAGRDVGYAQAYRIGDLPAGDVVPAPPDHVGLDYVIGEPELVGAGLGTRLIADLVELVPLLFPDATGIVASPHHRNAASLRVLEKNGFTPGLWYDRPLADGSTETLIACTRRLVG